MSIRLKLILTYIISVLLTAIILTAIGIGLFTAVLSYFATGIVKDQPVEEAIQRGIDLFVDLRYAERYTSEELTTSAYAEQLGDRMEPFGGFVVVRQGEQWDSYGKLKEEGAFLTQLQQDVSPPRSDVDDIFVMSTWEGRDWLSVRYDFSEVGEPLSYYLVTDVTDMEMKGDQFQFNVLLFIAILLGIILLPLIWITTKDIVRPLRQLEQASQRIAEGDLNFSLETKVQNEVGSVIRSYEKMRSELKRTINAQLALEENRKQLISNISHDLKSPLTSIKGYVEGIQEGIANDPEKLKRYMEVIHSKTLDMDRMIDDLFLYSKLDLEQERFHFEEIPLEEFYRQTMNELHMECESSGVRLTSDYEAGLDAVARMDPQKIKRVILNIVGNSVKFIDKEDPHIHVQFGRYTENWMISVTDNGPGMEPGELEKMFERFYRGDLNRSQNVAGTGLGLAIAKQIVKQHGGTIHASSELGRSMTVMFTIPIHRNKRDRSVGDVEAESADHRG